MGTWRAAIKECVQENEHFDDVRAAIEQYATSIDELQKKLEGCQNNIRCIIRQFYGGIGNVISELGNLNRVIASHATHADEETMKCFEQKGQEAWKKLGEIPNCFNL